MNNINGLFTCHKFSAVVYLHASSDIFSSSAMRHYISEAVCGKVFYQSPAVSSQSMSDSLELFKHFFLSVISVSCTLLFAIAFCWNSKKLGYLQVFSRRARLNTQSICPSSLSSAWLRLCLQNRHFLTSTSTLSLPLNTHPTQAFPLL